MLNLKNLNDTELVIQYQQTEAAAVFGEIYKRHHKHIISFCYKRINKWEVAKDLTQDIFIKISQKLHTLKDPVTFIKWAHQVAHNKCMDFLRAKKKLQICELTDQIRNNFEDFDGHEEMIEKEKMIQDVKILLEDLEPTSRTLLLEKYFEQKSIIDIANKHGLSQSAVKMRLLRTKKRVDHLFRQQTPAAA